MLPVPDGVGTNTVEKKVVTRLLSIIFVLIAFPAIAETNAERLQRSCLNIVKVIKHTTSTASTYDESFLQFEEHSKLTKDEREVEYTKELRGTRDGSLAAASGAILIAKGMGCAPAKINAAIICGYAWYGFAGSCKGHAK